MTQKKLEKLILASGNTGKLAEVNGLLSPFAIHCISQTELSVIPVVETGLTFIENALLKARHAALITGLPALADDSGLVVDYLQGEPGLYSARYAGSQANDAENNEKLLQKLQGVAEPERTAHYYCIIVLLRHARDPAPIVSEGRWLGRILSRPRGRGGFGYDPLFFLEEHQCTAAELTPTEKNNYSHRGQAMRQLITQLQSQQLL